VLHLGSGQASFVILWQLNDFWSGQSKNIYELA
jgi:hypothetical protein